MWAFAASEDFTMDASVALIEGFIPTALGFALVIAGAVVAIGVGWLLVDSLRRRG